MLFQISTYILSLFIFAIINNFIVVLIGTQYLRKYARKKEWGDSRKNAFAVNLLWNIIDLIPIMFSRNPIFFLYSIPIIFIINFILSTILIMELYKKKVGESLTLVIEFSIMTFLLRLFVVLVISFVYTFIELFYFEIIRRIGI
jgi:hypothetical protein